MQVVLICTLGMWSICLLALHIYAGEGRDPRRYDLVIPVGADEQIEAGENPLELPGEWNLVSGDVLVLDNREDSPQTIGAWAVEPGQRREILLRPFTGVVQCTLHPAGEISMNVAPLATDWKLAFIATMAFGPALGFGALAVGKVMRHVHDNDPDRVLPDPDAPPVTPSWVSRHPVGLALAGMSVVGLVATLLVLQPWEERRDATLAGFVESPTPFVAGLALPGVDGIDVPLAAAEGGLRMVFFGYASCPDVCPTTMSSLQRALEAADDAGVDVGRVDVAMVSVDPARDSAAHLDEYVKFFIPTADGLRTDDGLRLAEAAAAFGVTYELGPQEANGSYEVVHSAFVYAVDDAGNVVVSWPSTLAPELIAHDLAILLGRDDGTALG